MRSHQPIKHYTKLQAARESRNPHSFAQPAVRGSPQPTILSGDQVGHGLRAVHQAQRVVQQMLIRHGYKMHHQHRRILHLSAEAIRALERVPQALNVGALQPQKDSLAPNLTRLRDRTTECASCDCCSFPSRGARNKRSSGCDHRESEFSSTKRSSISHQTQTSVDPRRNRSRRPSVVNSKAGSANTR